MKYLDKRISRRPEPEVPSLHGHRGSLYDGNTFAVCPVFTKKRFIVNQAFTSNCFHKYPEGKSCLRTFNVTGTYTLPAG